MLAPRPTLLPAALALLACTPPAPAPARDQPQPSASTPSAAPSPAPAPVETPPATAASQRSGRLYLAVETAGVFKIDDAKGWQLWHTARESIRDMVEQDDTLVVVSSTGVSRVTRLGVSELIAPIDASTYAALGEPHDLALDRDIAWVAGREGIGRWDGKWTITPLTELGRPTTGDASAARPPVLAVDGDATTWLALDTLRRFDGNAWRDAEPDRPALEIAAGSGKLLIFSSCWAHHDEPLESCSLVKHDAEQPTTLSLDTTGCPPDRLLSVSTNGRYAALVSACGVLRIDTHSDTGSPQRLAFDDAGAEIEPTALAIDDSGRAWVGSGRGLTLVGPEPTQLEQLPLARLTDIAAPVGSLLVIGEGPTAPPLGSERRGGLRGKLVDESGQPLADTKLEACHGRSATPTSARDPITGLAPNDPTVSPCAGVEPRTSTTTGPDGSFEFGDLAIGSHVFAVEQAGQWTLARPKNSTMRAGMTGNIGKVVVYKY